MNLAKLSANGQIIVPAEVRRRLHLLPGDKLLFIEKSNGEVAVTEAGLAAMAQTQEAFAGAAADFGVSDGDGVQELVGDMRGARDSWSSSTRTSLSRHCCSPPRCRLRRCQDP